MEQERTPLKRVNAKFDLKDYNKLRRIQDWLREKNSEKSITLDDTLNYCVNEVYEKLDTTGGIAP